MEHITELEKYPMPAVIVDIDGTVLQKNDFEGFVRQQCQQVNKDYNSASAKVEELYLECARDPYKWEEFKAAYARSELASTKPYSHGQPK